MGDFRKLIAWQKANALAVAIHEAFRTRSSSAFTGLRAQIIAAAGSTADNLAEACARGSDAGFRKYSEDAYHSSKEVEGQLVRARDTRMIAHATFERLAAAADEVSRLCWTLAGRKKGEPKEGRKERRRSRGAETGEP